MLQTEQYSQSVMDLFPWHKGMGFAASGYWWRYVRSQPETDRLELLVMVALFSSEVSERLLKHDQALYEIFDIPEKLRLLLIGIDADSLEGFTERLMQVCIDETGLNGERSN